MIELLLKSSLTGCGRAGIHIGSKAGGRGPCPSRLAQWHPKVKCFTSPWGAVHKAPKRATAKRAGWPLHLRFRHKMAIAAREGRKGEDGYYLRACLQNARPITGKSYKQACS